MEYLDVAVALKAKEAKHLARMNRSRRNIFLLLGYLLTLGAMVIWSLIEPNLSPTSGTRFAVAIALGCVIGEMLLRYRSQTHSSYISACPVCSYSWEIKEGRSIPLAEQMGTWDRCPGCGLLMGDEIIDLSIRHGSKEANRV